MADLFSPMKFDEAQCKVKAAGTGDAIDPKHIAVDPPADNIITNDPQTGLKVVAEDFISAEEGNIAKKSLADGGILVKATDMVSDAECNALSVTNDGKLALIPEDLISDVMGGNPLGINPDDCKLYINPCLLPGPQNIVSKDEDNLIVEDPEDCSALLKFENVVSEDRGNLIIEGSDGKLSVQFQDIVDKDYFGAGLVYVERQDGSKVLQVAACDGLTFHEGTKTDVRGNEYYAKWLTVNLDEGQNLLYFVSGDECTECFEGCGELSIEFSLNANGEKLRILDRSGNVYKQINLSNGLQGDGSGGLTINTQDTIATTSPNDDKPISSKAVSAFAAPKYHANADKTIYGGGTGTLYGHVKLTDSLTDETNCKGSSVALSACAGKALKDMIDAIDTTQFAPIPHDDTTKKYGGGTGSKYGHVKLSDSTSSSSDADDSIAATPKAVKDAYDAGTRRGTCSQFGQVKLTDDLTLTSSCCDSSIGLSACAGAQLKQMIDDISSGGGGAETLVRYPLYATNFESVYDNNTNNRIRGQVVVPNFGSNSTRFMAHIQPLYYFDTSADSSGTYVWVPSDVPTITCDLQKGAQAKVCRLVASNHSNNANWERYHTNHDTVAAGAVISMVGYTSAQMSDIASALNDLGPIPLPTLAKFKNANNSYFSIQPYDVLVDYATMWSVLPKYLCVYQLHNSYATLMVKPEVNLSSLA